MRVARCGILFIKVDYICILSCINIMIWFVEHLDLVGQVDDTLVQ